MIWLIGKCLLSLRPTWSTEKIPAHPGLHSETASKNKYKKKKKMKAVWVWWRIFGIVFGSICYTSGHNWWRRHQGKSSDGEVWARDERRRATEWKELCICCWLLLLATKESRIYLCVRWEWLTENLEIKTVIDQIPWVGCLTEMGLPQETEGEMATGSLDLWQDNEEATTMQRREFSSKNKLRSPNSGFLYSPMLSKPWPCTLELFGCWVSLWGAWWRLSRWGPPSSGREE